jgi:hypothetical protein
MPHSAQSWAPRHVISSYVCWHGDGMRYTTFSAIFRKSAARAGVPFRCHDLRHQFASEFAQQIGDIAALQAILGHKTIAMTMRYSHLITEHLHRAMGRYGAKAGTNTGTTPAKIDDRPATDPEQGANISEASTISPGQ